MEGNGQQKKPSTYSITLTGEIGCGKFSLIKINTLLPVST